MLKEKQINCKLCIQKIYFFHIKSNTKTNTAQQICVCRYPRITTANEARDANSPDRLNSCSTLPSVICLTAEPSDFRNLVVVNKVTFIYNLHYYIGDIISCIIYLVNLQAARV